MMDPIASNPTPRAGTDEPPVGAVGVELDAVEVRLSRWHGGEDGHAAPVALGDPSVPPTLVLPRYAGEPVHADLAWPVHPRATGDHWPPEARVTFGDNEPAPPRMPMAYAWPMLAHGTRWEWAPAPEENRGRGVWSISAADAIAHLLAAARHAADLGRSEQILVTPTHLEESAKNQLRRAAAEQGLNVRLVSRAVAAAMGRLALHAGRLKRRATVLSLHLGFDEWEANAVDLRRVTEGDDARIRPAVRESPDPALLSMGMLMMHRAAERSIEISHRQPNPGRVWELLWCTPWLQTAFDALVDAADDEQPWQLHCLAPHVRRREFLWQQCRAAMQRAPDVGADVPALLDEYRPGRGGFGDIRDWVNAQRKQLAGETIEGVIVTGPLARVPADESGTSFAEHYLKHLAVKCKDVVIEGRDVAPGLLAHGAAMLGRHPWDD